MPAVRSGIARRYAEAVFEIAKEHNSFDRWTADLDSIARAAEEPDIARLLAAPAVGMSVKESIVNRYLADLSPLASNLVRVLLHKGRFPLAPQIAAHYRALLNEYRGIATAEVVSAVPLTDEELKAVALRLTAMTGKRVIAEPQVDPSLIGGITARVGDQLIDASVRGRLEALRKRLVSA